MENTTLKRKWCLLRTAAALREAPRLSLYPTPHIHRIEPGLPAGIAGPVVQAPALPRQLHTQTSSASLGSCLAPKHSLSGVPSLETSRHGQASCCQDLGRRQSLTELSRLLLGPQFASHSPQKALFRCPRWYSSVHC